MENFFKQHPDTDTVLHMAAFTDTNVAWDEKNNKSGLCWRLNAEGTSNIVNLCQKYSKYLIFISTDYALMVQKRTVY